MRGSTANGNILDLQGGMNRNLSIGMTAGGAGGGGAGDDATSGTVSAVTCGVD